MNRLWKVGAVALPGVYLLDQWRHSNQVQATSAKTNKPEVVTNLSPSSQLISPIVEHCKQSVSRSIQETRHLVEVFRVRSQAPGVSVAVSHKGRVIWSEGFGFSDLENATRCRDQSVMRIASISKCITAALVARLVDQGKLDLDKPIREYLGDKFPIKRVDNKQVDITLRQLLTHTAGIRHYHVKKGEQELEASEYYVTKACDNAYDSLDYFKEDDLMHNPGERFRYTTYGFSLVGAVIQSVLDPKQSLQKAMIDMCKYELGMFNTYLDEHKPLIANRANYYYKSSSGKLANVPFVDNSYKWAGGGLLSNVLDLTRFANALIASYKTDQGFVRQKTMNEMWSPLVPTGGKISNELSEWNSYGLGWFVIRDSILKHKNAAEPPFRQIMYHSGAAVGATSFLLVLPEEELVVAVLTNLNSCYGVSALAFNIAKTFHKSI
jgi:serine beta-lactamase-like protein LACTB